MKLKLPRSTHNWTSLVGATIALISFFMIIFLFTISTFFLKDAAYIGLVTYILLPAVLICGLILIPIGMYIKIQKQRKTKKTDTPGWPTIDLKNIRHRTAFFIFSAGTTLFLFLSAIGSYEAFHFTDSVQFCGTVCHDVMKPEYTAYQTSSHARVTCVDCHVGSGADWYVRSKMSGLYQVYAVLANVFPKPIPTPIENLRPARETCEQCHWPQKFYTQKLRKERYYLSDEENSPWDIQLIMKIGAEHSALGLKMGIHWHINPDIKIEYIAVDEKREEIPWVRLVNLQSGDTAVYQDEENPLDSLDVNKTEIRTMDCIDCHTRPSHDYRPPSLFVNEAITAGNIPIDLPEIKSLLMEMCEDDYASLDSAKKEFNTKILEFYESDYPEIFEEKRNLIEKAISGFQEAYSQNIFPEMKTNWSEYPNHIGHIEFDGCFRCHNDRHATEAGDIISKNCNLCHTISAQGNPNELEVAVVGEALEFKHPVDIDGEWKEELCTECHTGLSP